MKILAFVAVLVSFLVFSSCNNQAQVGEDKFNENKQVRSTSETVQEAKVTKSKAPDFALKNHKGETVSLSSFEDKVIILNFWATWCGPCRREIPGFVDLYNKYNDDGLEIIGVSVDQNGWEAVKPFMENYDMNYPVVMFNHQVVKDYGGIRGIPTTFLINRKGEVVEKIGGWRPDSYFEQRVKELL